MNKANRTIEMPYKVMLISLKAAIDIAEATGGEITMTQYTLRTKAVECLDLLTNPDYDKEVLKTYIDDIGELLHHAPTFISGGFVGKKDNSENGECVINKNNPNE